MIDYVLNNERQQRSIEAMRSYVQVYEELVQRILKLIPTNPKLLTLSNPHALFQLVDCTDLQPSLLQASWALQQAQRLAKDKP